MYNTFPGVLEKRRIERSFYFVIVIFLLLIVFPSFSQASLKVNYPFQVSITLNGEMKAPANESEILLVSENNAWNVTSASWEAEKNITTHFNYTSFLWNISFLIQNTTNLTGTDKLNISIDYPGNESLGVEVKNVYTNSGNLNCSLVGYWGNYTNITCNATAPQATNVYKVYLTLAWNVSLEEGWYEQLNSSVAMGPLIRNFTDIFYRQHFSFYAPFPINVTANVSLIDANLTIVDQLNFSSDAVTQSADSHFIAFNITNLNTTPQKFGVDVVAKRIGYLEIDVYEKQLVEPHIILYDSGISTITETNVTYEFVYSFYYNTSEYKNLEFEVDILHNFTKKDDLIEGKNYSQEILQGSGGQPCNNSDYAGYCEVRFSPSENNIFKLRTLEFRKLPIITLTLNWTQNVSVVSNLSVQYFYRTVNVTNPCLNTSIENVTITQAFQEEKLNSSVIEAKEVFISLLQQNSTISLNLTTIFDLLNETLSWRQDPTRITRANSTAYITLDVYATRNYSFGDPFHVEVAYGRNGWSCKGSNITIDADGLYNFTVNCSKENVVIVNYENYSVQDNVFRREYVVNNTDEELNFTAEINLSFPSLYQPKVYLLSSKIELNQTKFIDSDGDGYFESVVFNYTIPNSSGERFLVEGERWLVIDAKLSESYLYEGEDVQLSGRVTYMDGEGCTANLTIKIYRNDNLIDWRFFNLTPSESFSLLLENLDEGNYKIEFFAKDTMNYTGSKELQFTVTVPPAPPAETLPPTVPSYESKYFEKFFPGSNEVRLMRSYLHGVTKLVFNLKGEYKDVRIKVKRLWEKPGTLPSPNHEAIKYVEVELQNLPESAFNWVRVDFKISKEKLNFSEGIKVFVERYDEEASAWRAYEASFQEEDEYYYYFTANLPKLSYLAFTWKYEAPKPKPVCGNGICEEGENETTCPQDCKPVVKKECPPCPSCSPWSGCIEGKQTRTCWKCGPETNYTCVSYQEERECEVAVPVTNVTEEKRVEKLLPSWYLVGICCLLVLVVAIAILFKKKLLRI